EQFAIQFVADGRDVAALLRAEDVAGAANFQIAHRDGESSPHVTELFDGSQPLGRIARKVLIRIDQQIAVRAVLIPPDPATKLVQVGQAVSVSLVDENRVGIWDIEAAFDNGRGQQNVELMIDEIQHYAFQTVLGHLSVRDSDACFGHDVLQSESQKVDVA